MNETEKKVIANLRRRPNQKILARAAEISTPKSTVFEIIRRMEREGIIVRSTHLDFPRIGYPVRIFFAVKTVREERGNLEHYLREAKNVNTLHRVNSGFDFHGDAVFRDQKEAQEFLEDLEEKNKVLGKIVFNAIEPLHVERFLTD